MMAIQAIGVGHPDVSDLNWERNFGVPSMVESAAVRSRSAMGASSLAAKVSIGRDSRVCRPGISQNQHATADNDTAAVAHHLPGKGPDIPAGGRLMAGCCWF